MARGRINRFGVMLSMLLEMRDRKGWKALGYESWEEYGEKEWEYSVNYLNRITGAGYTQSVIVPIGTKEIPESQLRPLSSTPESERTTERKTSIGMAYQVGNFGGTGCNIKLVNKCL